MQDQDQSNFSPVTMYNAMHVVVNASKFAYAASETVDTLKEHLGYVNWNKNPTYRRSYEHLI